MSDHNKPSSSGHSKRRETEEERSIRKEKERKARETETEEERKVRKEKERKREEERRTTKSGNERRKETEEERLIRKEKEASGRRRETESERAIRKENEKRERENETEEERKVRKQKEREKEEERRLRKEKEKSSASGNKETKDGILKHKESKDRLQIKCEENTIKTETMELDEDYFLKEEAKLANKEKSSIKNEDISMKEEPVDESNGFIHSHVSDSGDDSDVPLAKRQEKVKKRKAAKKNEDDHKKKPAKRSKSNHDEDKNNNNKKPKKAKGKAKEETDDPKPTKKMTKKEKELEEEKNVWKWWENKDEDGNIIKATADGTKWKFLEHKGPLLAPEYEPLPPEVRFWYDGKIMRLSEATEEVGTFYGKMLDHDYTTKEVFNKNFFKDWRKVMTKHEKEKITDLTKCDFSEINEHFKKMTEERKARSKEEKQAEKEKNAKIQEEFGICTLDGHQEKIGNYRVEPPGLFRGRGEHPKQGMVKLRVPANEIIINCSRNSKAPDPPEGQQWKEVRHDNTVTWLASWTENVQGQIKYVMLNPSSKLKAEKDMDKYEKARLLKEKIGSIREDYEKDLSDGRMNIRQRAVALYFIDKLALRAGNEKDEDQADTVGCCSLRVEHVEVFSNKDGKEFCV